MSLPAKHTLPSEVKFLINKVKEGKSLSYNLITNKIFKNLPNKIVLILYIFNSMLWVFHFLLIRKLTTVIVIPKLNKRKNEITSYKPISLLPILAKLFEKIIRIIIRSILQTYNIIPHSQFGFKTKHSTIH